MEEAPTATLLIANGKCEGPPGGGGKEPAGWRGALSAPLWPLRRRPLHREPPCGAVPEARLHGRWGARKRGSGYSFMVLYINSSSSRAPHFLWTRGFFPMLARGCVAANSVRRAAQSPGLTDNNFGAAPSSVDNQQVVPQLPPGLSTNAVQGDRLRGRKAQSPGSSQDPGLGEHGKKK